jgi:hypothetical protein
MTQSMLLRFLIDRQWQTNGVEYSPRDERKLLYTPILTVTAIEGAINPGLDELPLFHVHIHLQRLAAHTDSHSSDSNECFCIYTLLRLQRLLKEILSMDFESSCSVLNHSLRMKWD